MRQILPAPDELGADMAQARAVTLASERLGIIAKMDVVEVSAGAAMPVDFKKGKRPHVAAGAYEPERVQICTQAMVLEDHGYAVEQGVLWYAGSRERVQVLIDDELRARNLEAIAGLRSVAANGRRPPPLENSPKCRAVRWLEFACRTRPIYSARGIRRSGSAALRANAGGAAVQKRRVSGGDQRRDRGSGPD